MNRRSKQRGAALVESALTISFFLLMVMGIIEFAFMMYTWARAYEGARETVRTAIVSDPVTNLDALDCSGGGGSTSLTVNCNNEKKNCKPLVDVLKLFVPNIEYGNLEISYSCTDVGFDGRPDEKLIPQVKVELVNLTHQMVIPDLIGLPGSWPIPSMTSTRIGEDMHTVVPD